MDIRVGVTVLLVLAGTLMCDARNLIPVEFSGCRCTTVYGLENADGNIDVCTLCEDYTQMAISYLSEGKTQDEIMESLHKTCLELHGFANQCTTLVNYYAPLFFTHVSSIEPEGFCKKFGLCRVAIVSPQPEKQTPCDLCHKAMDEALEKLKDPDTELEVIQVLLKACDVVRDYSKKCKSLVFEYGPLILVDAGKFFEKVDLCTTFHACRRKNFDAQPYSNEGRIEMVVSS